MCASRSGFWLRPFTRFASFFTTPESTLKYESRPANGSATVLNTNADTGCLSAISRCVSRSFDLPATGPRAVGGGKNWLMKFSTRSVPTL